MTAITLDNVCIIFGKMTDGSLALADKGKSRSDIQAETGHVLGVHNCSITIEEGEIVVLMGLSGSGKSTLLRAINRLNPISRGSVVVHNNGRSIDVGKADKGTLRDLRKHLVSMVFQQFGLLPWRTVEENVGFGLELSGVPKEERAKAVQQQLELVNLKDWAKRKVGELSGGMQQRVGLARAFATGAPILLMDEPFSALDPLIRTRLQDELLSLQARLKKTIVFVSHDLDEAMKIGNRIAIMEGGRIIQCGTAQDILLNPADDYVADFVANMNPLGVLTAADIMVPLDRTRPASRPFAATARPETPVREIMQAVAKNSGDVGVVDKGTILGMISADDIVRGLLRHQKH
ncbi:glycine betaine/proline transport system ATP-binding protein [Phyllobacterium sp. CL33Tsu]|uniref:choline ABC transporter ATP-binding protein n=1 Tax=Phyllobacterium sp. CL33Tsu TaxID=1798191 RepID=UPI0008ED5902|nr:choline ABC transporter ATP-binding protein [Phyllobacterium sp. CL33Tsu]SFJ36144.1 glycine betaine/proline transport system ATP-binding protein [Phyllobacterium sp. CL33Tsu]